MTSESTRPLRLCFVSADYPVHVEGRDKNGQVVATADPAPTTQHIEPGSSTTFSATFDRRPEIDEWHAEATSR